MFVLVILGYALLGVYEFVPLYKENKRRELYVNAALGIVSFAAAMLLSLGIDIPSPAKAIESLVRSLTGK